MKTQFEGIASPPEPPVAVPTVVDSVTAGAGCASAVVTDSKPTFTRVMKHLNCGYAWVFSKGEWTTFDLINLAKPDKSLYEQIDTSANRSNPRCWLKNTIYSKFFFETIEGDQLTRQQRADVSVYKSNPSLAWEHTLQILSQCPRWTIPCEAPLTWDLIQEAAKEARESLRSCG